MAQPGGAEITLAPDTGKKELFLKAFKVLLETMTSTLVWIIPYLSPHLHFDLGASRPAGHTSGEGTPSSSCSHPRYLVTQLLFLRPPLYKPGVPWGPPGLGLASPALVGGSLEACSSLRGPDGPKSYHYKRGWGASLCGVDIESRTECVRGHLRRPSP